jgi:hypothetical protein
MEERHRGILLTLRSSGLFRKVVSLVLAFLFAVSSPLSMSVAFAETGSATPTADQNQTPPAEPATKSADKPVAPLGSGDTAMQSVIQAVNAQNAQVNTPPSTSAAPASQNGQVSSDKKTTTNQPSGAGSGPIVTPFVGGDTPPHLDREAIISQVKPDQTGALNYQIPIVVPPGRTKATTPDLSLSYSSRDGEDISPFGYGWSVNIPYIERENKLGTNNLYSRYDFYSTLDGELWGATTSPGTSGQGGGPTSFALLGGGGSGSSAPKAPITRKAAIAKGLAKTNGSSATTTPTQPVEVTSARTLTSKTFLTGWAPDGSAQYSQHLYSSPIQYVDQATGQFADIDTTLVSTSTGWTMDKAAYHARIHGDQQLSFDLAAPRNIPAIGKKTASGVAKNKEITFSGALGNGINLSLLVDADRVVKDVVINRLSALGNLSQKQYYEIPFKLTGNHPLTITVDGQTLTQRRPITSQDEAAITDASTSVVTYLWPPAADDASPKSNIQHHFPISIRYELQSDGSVLITKLLPVSWLQQATFPVKADVTLSTFSGSGDGWESQVGTTWSSAHNSSTGLNATYNITDTEIRADDGNGGPTPMPSTAPGCRSTLHRSRRMRSFPPQR